MGAVNLRIPGNKSLAEINRLVAQQESRQLEFEDIQSVIRDGHPTSIVSFKLTEGLAALKALSLKLKSETPPPGTSSVWIGRMAIKGKVEEVVAYRERKQGVL